MSAVADRVGGRGGFPPPKAVSGGISPAHSRFGGNFPRPKLFRGELSLPTLGGDFPPRS